MDSAQQLNLQELLKWGISNATKSEDPTIDKPDLEKLDPKWVDIILGKPDAARMKDAMAVIADSSKNIEDRLLAFDELELLVESIDNANDLKPCNLWKPLLAQFQDPSEDIRVFAAWVTATAIQNNPDATKDWSDANGFEVLEKAVQSETSEKVVAKAVNIVSALVNMSNDHIATLHARGILAKLAAHLHHRPRHAASKRLFHVFRNAIDAVPNLAVLFSAPGWLDGVVDIHIRCTTEDVDYLEKCLAFIVACSLAKPSAGTAPSLKKSVYRELLDVALNPPGDDAEAMDQEVVDQLRTLAA
ncbi:hsp70 nucleotide exchange factor fes1 [Allomyces javanicus]|nr:hsp70 nucleotide exchange factor fes1 [Allomyces javanicus]